MEAYSLGIDIGSTTVKAVVFDFAGEALFTGYMRHHANIKEGLCALLRQVYDALGDVPVSPVITGSGGLTLASGLHTPFVQEVIAVSDALRRAAPQTDVAIELGGEDAKIIYFENGNVEQRMNGICAGGTGAFIDQMASLLQTDASGLNELAKSYHELYPIAARCGVFAKSDIQPLMNDGVTREDLAASIFQAVVNQTISGLACGKPIRGHVAFLGGPLYFLTELRAAFIRTLSLDDEHVVFPENAHLFAAAGAAMHAPRASGLLLSRYLQDMEAYENSEFKVQHMPPLFEDEAAYRAFTARHGRARVRTADLSSYAGPCYVGLDAGSTTTKAALIGADGELLYSYYSSNNGSPLETAIRALTDLYARLPPSAHIAGSCSTGYGEALMKEAFALDEGEVETIAHYYAAAFFEPQVDCILDIGGQDMKCIKIRNAAVDSVMLNEACSSGCGSFLETFAKSLGYTVEDFAREALFARHPIDLGTRCTVFMNSKVKQAQKEGATVADISAGLAYSIIKNALYKVIKVSDASELGRHIVVQGGTFYNDAVLRSFEKTANCTVTRPDIAGIMGAFGAALIARERCGAGHQSSLLSPQALSALTYTTRVTSCHGCTNQCRLTVNRFSNGRRHVSGNRCERGAGQASRAEGVPNLFKYKYERSFRYTPLALSAAPRGEIGIPRVLNLYENYPFWFTFFTRLGYRVVLSPASSRKLYELGLESIPSESECFPAKLAHGHVAWLLQNGVKHIFYPCVPYERAEFPDAVNHFNCPIVTSYAENIRNNVEQLHEDGVVFRSPFVAFTELATVERALAAEFSDLPAAELHEACRAAWEELAACRADIRREGERALAWLRETGGRGIVLAGRPYHVDPEIHHGIPDMIASYGVAVLTEDSVSHLAPVERPLRVNDQWMYHTRLYAAANFVRTRPELELIQLNSFGCGLDAVTTDQVSEILESGGKIYTCIKIDEINNLGAARIRVRSLLAASRLRASRPASGAPASSAFVRPVFTRRMRRDYTILCPQMSPIHFSVLEAAFHACGYKLRVLPNDNREAVDVGLRYVNNDACYPSMMVVGQIMQALLSGEYDLDRVAVIMTQTGGGCRASNYIAFIRRALKKAGMGRIPVISLNLNGMEKNPGFTLSPDLIMRVAYAGEFGDILMKCLYRTRPYELVPGAANALHEKWDGVCREFVSSPHPSFRRYEQLCREMIRAFDALPIRAERKPRVGVVGEILVKYLPAANNSLVDVLEREGAEAVVPELLDFLNYCFYNQNFKAAHLGTPKRTARLANLGIRAIERLRRAAVEEYRRSEHFDPPSPIGHIAAMTQDVVSLGNQCGEGWFLTGEMLELMEAGVTNIVCTQPFACLPNHVVGKGVIKELRRRHPGANIVAIDYDPGASEVNQLNRIKLMLSNAAPREREPAYEC